MLKNSIGLCLCILMMRSPILSLCQESPIAKVLTQVIDEYFTTCHVTFVVGGGNQTEVTGAIRSLTNTYHAGILINVHHLYDVNVDLQEGNSTLQILQERDSRFSCHAIFLEVDNEQNLQLTGFRYLADIDLYLKPEIFVVMVGSYDNNIRKILSHYALRNAAQAVYIAFPTYALQDERRAAQTVRLKSEDSKYSKNATCSNESNKCEVTFYRRCLYCMEGEIGTKVVDTWLSTGFIKKANIFPDQFQNFYGHKFRIVSMNWFPMLDFTLDSDEPATTVTPKDSLDYRMLKAISSILNFTYEMRTPPDGQWGVSLPNGSWTGTVGTLQRNDADFSMLLSWLATRMEAVDYSRVYISETLIIVTTKSGPLPQILSLARPFPVELWIAVLALSMVAGLTIWLLQRIRGKVLERNKNLTLSTSLLYSWRILLEDPPVNLPTNITAQMLIGWWWVFCYLITTAYRSSLIAHLTVPDKSPTIDTFEQLLKADGWTWGMEETYGIAWEWFKTTTILTAQKIFDKSQPMTPEKHMELVLKGNHAFLTWKYYIKAIIDSKYTDSRGYSPIHTGRQEYINFGGYGWGFRKGAPFRSSIDILKLNLIESGLINYWMDDLILTSSRIARKNNQKKWNFQKEQEGAGQVVLGLQHLQGLFYLLFLGYIIGFIILILENLAKYLK